MFATRAMPLPRLATYGAPPLASNFPDCWSDSQRVTRSTGEPASTIVSMHLKICWFCGRRKSPEVTCFTATESAVLSSKMPPSIERSASKFCGSGFSIDVSVGILGCCWAECASGELVKCAAARPALDRDPQFNWNGKEVNPRLRRVSTLRVWKTSTLFLRAWSWFPVIDKMGAASVPPLCCQFTESTCCVSQFVPSAFRKFEVWKAVVRRDSSSATMFERNRNRSRHRLVCESTCVSKVTIGQVRARCTFRTEFLCHHGCSLWKVSTVFIS